MGHAENIHRLPVSGLIITLLGDTGAEPQVEGFRNKRNGEEVASMKIDIRKDKMSRDERFVALLNRREMDRLPVWGSIYGFSTVNAGFTLNDFYHNPQKSYKAQMLTATKFGFQDIPSLVYVSFGGWEFGGDIRWPTGEYDQAPIVARYPVQTEDDAWELKVPDVRDAGIVPMQMEVARQVVDSASAYVVAFVCGPFTTAGNLAGAEQLCRWMMKKPELAHRLLRLSTDFLVELVRYWARTIAPRRILFRSAEPTTANQLISPKQFEEFAFPYIKELCENMLATGSKHIDFHVCGEQNKNLPLWAKVPFGEPGLISVGAEVDLETASQYFPDHIIEGNIDPTIIASGTPEQVYENTKGCIQKGLKHPGGFQLRTGCEFPPVAEEANVWAIFQAVSDYGWF